MKKSLILACLSCSSMVFLNVHEKFHVAIFSFMVANICELSKKLYGDILYSLVNAS